MELLLRHLIGPVQHSQRGAVSDVEVEMQSLSSLLFMDVQAVSEHGKTALAAAYSALDWPASKDIRGKPMEDFVSAMLLARFWLFGEGLPQVTFHLLILRSACAEDLRCTDKHGAPLSCEVFVSCTELLLQL